MKYTKKSRHFISTCAAFAFLTLASVVLFADDNTAIIAEVLDAGTLRVEYQDREETLRLIGIDVPEIKSDEAPAAQGQENAYTEDDRRKALDFVNSLVYPGYKIRLEFDFEQRDRHDRLLAYVYLPDNSMLNYAIIMQGYAAVLVEPPNVKYAGSFQRAYGDAIDHNRGLWKDKNVTAPR